MPPPKNVKLILSIPKEIKEKAELICQQRKISMAEFFIELIEREASEAQDPFAFLDGIWEDRQITAEEIRERAWKRS